MPKIVTTLLLLFVIPATIAQESDPTSPAENLAPLAYLVGDTWTAEGELPGFGNYTAERSYQWILGGRFIQQRNVMSLPGNQFETLGILGWDPDQQTIVTWGFGDDGGIATTYAVAVNDNEIQLQGERIAAFNAGPVRATFRKVNDNEFVEIAESQQGGEWVAMFQFRFTRNR